MQKTYLFLLIHLFNILKAALILYTWPNPKKQRQMFTKNICIFPFPPQLKSSLQWSFECLHIYIYFMNLSQVALQFVKSLRKPAFVLSSDLCSAFDSSTTTPAPSACRTCTSSADSARSHTTLTSALRSVCAASGWTSPSWPRPTKPRPSPLVLPGFCFTAWSRGSTK